MTVLVAGSTPPQKLNGSVIALIWSRNSSMKALASLREPNRSGKTGAYFRVLNQASE